MKRGLLTLIAIALFQLSASIAQDFDITVESIYEAPQNTQMKHVKSAIDSKGNLHTVFLDGAHGFAYYATNSSGSWKFEKLTYFDEGYNETVEISSFPNIAIDKNDNISIVMFGRYKEDLLYASGNVSGTGWEFTNAKKTSDLMKFRIFDEYADMCVDKNGGLHIYSCATIWDENNTEHWMSAVYFYKPASGNWQMEMIMPGVANKISYAADPSIATHGDKVYVTIGGDRDLHFGSKNISGGQWKIEKLVDYKGGMNTWKHHTSICVSPQGNPKFAYFEYDQESDNFGINIMSKDKCGTGEWIADQGIDGPEHKKRPAIAMDAHGKTYIAFGGKDLFLYTETCECNQKWERLYHDANINTEYTDVVIDKQNNVHFFYTYEQKVYHLKAEPKTSTEACNYRPSISFDGKTNVKPGEEWSTTINASDPECDPVEIYSIIMPDGFDLIDHGNGSATFKGYIEMPEGQTDGEVVLNVFCKDDKHPGSNGKNAGMAIKLKITAEGNEKGAVTYTNNCPK